MDVPTKIMLVVLGIALFMTSFGVAKEPETPVVNLVVKDESLREVLRRISKITGYDILLNGDKGDL